ncbi:cupredoxin domain-containing protein [Arthrobacter sp. ISL-69]|uniref:cupredoxin domain-containing protein n=1 Tax=Arthrobacter sp. ISL-69 TaxID=2819113 RepID=UPI001BE68CA0|nr:cupredoxin domain-containing protein [Arthrobacter sp. ISL-69]MBT2538468.1 cupredoxin domain-containing protein [Arthrobacter sp. ISL-69]
MKIITRVLAVAAAVSLAGISGCAAREGGPPAPQPVASNTPSAPSAAASAPANEPVITIRDFAYEVPASVSPGAMVTVTNADRAPHTVTVKNEGGFDVEVPAGGTVTFQAPDTAGEYGIICSFHPQMTGTLIIK